MAVAEQWRSVVGWEGFYEVSDHGRVRSVDRVIHYVIHGGAATKTLVGQIMKLATHTHGYAQVSMRRQGFVQTRLVHALVLEAFVGPAPNGMEGCHDDNDKFNNRLTNLRWDTHKANCEDRTRHGVQVMGETCGQAVLTEVDVASIRDRAAEGILSNKEIADIFGTTGSNIGHIVKRRSWKHI